MENYLQDGVVIGVLVLLALLFFNFFSIHGLNAEIGEKISELKEQARPAEMEMIIIRTDCVDCFDIDSIVSAADNSGLILIDSKPINVTSEQILYSSSQEAKNLIDDYGIEKLPVIMLRGELNKFSSKNFKQINDAMIFISVAPPYVDAKTGEAIGKVSSIIISDKNCGVCDDFSTLIQTLEQSDVVFSENKELDFNSTETENIITKYRIQKIPALLLSRDIDAYSDIVEILTSAGIELQNDYYVLEAGAPYVETETGTIRGLITLTILNDSSCQECYDVAVHKSILARLGVAIGEEETIDISSSDGKALMKKYNITKVPVIILTGDAAVYENLNDAWPSVGTVENDGTYVFRNPEVMGVTYKDLVTNEIIE